MYALSVCWRCAKLSLRAANKTLLALLPDLAVMLVLSAVVRLNQDRCAGFC